MASCGTEAFLTLKASLRGNVTIQEHFLSLRTLSEHSSSSTAISLKGIYKSFGSKVAVNNLDLNIPTHSTYGFIGPNGAGKTTTIRMIMSIIFPDKGELSILGRNSAVESKDRIGYLPEERGLYKKMKVAGFIEYIARLKGMDSAGLEKRVHDWLDRVGLADNAKKRCEELSKGMQQKVQFIAAVIHGPDLIILDEPFSGLDPVNRRLLRSLIDEQRSQGRTLIFSTHAMFEAEQLCTHLFMIHRGNKVLDMPLPEVFRAYDPRLVLAEPMNGVANQELANHLRGCEGVEGTNVSGTVIECRLRSGTDPARTMTALVNAAPLRRVELKRPNLEEIFINLVGGDAAALRAESEDSSDGASIAPAAVGAGAAGRSYSEGDE
jgi:ABC-2 type transport system ATP-binding protein